MKFSKLLANKSAMLGSLSLFFLLGASSIASAASAVDQFSLITKEELASEKKAEQAQIASKAPVYEARIVPVPGAPQLTIVTPLIQNPVKKTPVRIELAFQAETGAHIVPESFRVLYGMLRLDITERLRKHGVVTEKGAVAEKAEMPSGTHRLYIKIADDQGRVTERELKIAVELD